MSIVHGVGAGSQTPLMREMIHRLDVDLLELAYDRLGATYAGASETCAACLSRSTCKAWLAGATGDAMPEFCPNLRVFSRFRRS